MNKNVFTYLSGKANNVKDYIKSKAEAAGNYISDHAQDIKNGAIKTTATLLTAAALVTGMTACDTTPSNDPQTSQQEQQNSNTLYPIVTVKPREEIEAEGITSKDVLALYDNLAYLYAKNKLQPYADIRGYDVKDISAQFDNVHVCKISLKASGNTQMVDDPFYCPINDNGYLVRYNYNSAIKDKKDHYHSDIIITQETFKTLMDSFNIAPIELTEEYWKENPTYVESHKHLTGKTVYPSFQFTRDIINNANEEQLWALYNVGNELTIDLKSQTQNIEMSNQ